MRSEGEEECDKKNENPQRKDIKLAFIRRCSWVGGRAGCRTHITVLRLAYS